MRASLIKAVGAATVVALSSVAVASAASVTVDPSAAWIGYMNVFNLPADGHGWQFGSGWGTADLNAVFAGPVLTLSPNTNIARDNPKTDTFWWKPDGSPNKEMDANMYVQNDSLAGDTVTFAGSVLNNTLVAPYTSVAFIKDFVSDYSSFTQTTVALTPGSFSISLATNPGDHIQYGFETVGPQSASVDSSSLGFAQVTAPEPASLSALAGLGLLAARRRRA